MGGSSVPKPQQVAPPVPAPKEEDKAVQDAAAEALRRKRMAAGYRSTVLTNTMLTPESTKALQTMGS
jgi:hypothetical protein